MSPTLVLGEVADQSMGRGPALSVHHCVKTFYGPRAEQEGFDNTGSGMHGLLMPGFVLGMELFGNL